MVSPFLGFSLNTDFTGDHQKFEVYATYNTDTYATLNVYNADVTFDGGAIDFRHNDFAYPNGGSFKPSFSGNGKYTDPEFDSYVTIGYGVGAQAASNQCALDPNFGDGLGGSIPTNAGWFNQTPDNPQYPSTTGQLLAFVMALTFSIITRRGL